MIISLWSLLPWCMQGSMLEEESCELTFDVSYRESRPRSNQKGPIKTDEVLSYSVDNQLDRINPTSQSKDLEPLLLNRKRPS
jgi:hypothetical protein